MVLISLLDRSSSAKENVAVFSLPPSSRVRAFVGLGFE